MYSEGAVTCPDPELMCHRVDAELVKSYREPELYLEEGGFCRVQLSVALHLWPRNKAYLLISISYCTSSGYCYQMLALRLSLSDERVGDNDCLTHHSIHSGRVVSNHQQTRTPG